MSYKNIIVARQDPLVYLILNRTDKFNALSREMMGEIACALTELSTESGAKVIIIRAEGKHFCTGHDLGEMKGGSTVDFKDIFDRCHRMMDLLHDVPQPVIAQVQGLATAAGCQLVAACDLAVAEENATFATPGVQIGLFCSTPMVPLSRSVGRKRALEMLLTGRRLSAAEAVDWGLINAAVPMDNLAEETRRLAMTIAEASPLTVAIGKRVFYDQIDLPAKGAYGVAKNAMCMNLNTHDAQEGISSFLEKRKPVWLGK